LRRVILPVVALEQERSVAVAQLQRRIGQSVRNTKASGTVAPLDSSTALRKAATWPSIRVLARVRASGSKGLFGSMPRSRATKASRCRLYSPSSNGPSTPGGRSGSIPSSSSNRAVASGVRLQTNRSPDREAKMTRIVSLARLIRN
jgi:hypothetical protein